MWVTVAHDKGQKWALVKTKMISRVLQNSGNFLSSWETLTFLSMILFV